MSFGKNLKGLSKNLSLSLAALMVFVLAMEGLTRAGLFVYTGSPRSFAFGIDGKVKVWFPQDGRICFVKDRAEESGAAAPKAENPNSRTVTLAAFGGSTTRGYNCSEAASSWPEDLEKSINGGAGSRGLLCRVLNYGANGANSDYAVEALEAVGERERLDFALWANFMNESDVLFTGPERNLEALSEKEEFKAYLKNKETSFAAYRYRLLAHRVDKTLGKYSLFYLALSRAAIKAKVSMLGLLDIKVEKKPDYWNGLEEQDGLIRLALENYRLNFLDAKRYCDSHNIVLVLIRLPENTLFDSPDVFHARFRERLEKLMGELSARYGVQLINVQDEYESKGAMDGLFCDICHQTREGHALTADIIARELRGVIANRRLGGMRKTGEMGSAL